MSRTQLRVLAVILTTLIIAVGFNAFDRLPGSVRDAIAAERTALASAETGVRSAQSTVSRELQSEAAFFQPITQSREWPGRLQQAGTLLASARGEMDQLTDLEKHGHHRDTSRAETLLTSERTHRTNAASLATTTQQAEKQWLDRKQHLPEETADMERDYRSIHDFNADSLKGTVQKAETDWPDKKADLDTRLAALTSGQARAESLWQSSASVRSEAAAGKLPDAEVAALFGAASELKSIAAALPAQSTELRGLTGQLYDSWDQVLVDMDRKGSGDERYRQDIRTIRTHAGSTTSNDQWVSVSEAVYDQHRDHLGMAIAHKPAGKYDSEAEHVAQPAGFAYIAPPGQASNQYGYWDHRNGQSFWVFYGQYALLRDLLFNRQYRPLDRYEWEDYSSSRNRGQTYYGRDTNSGGEPKYGTFGSSTRDRYAGSTYGQGGGFRDSPYASKSGTFRSSPYASPSVRDPDADHSPRSFGRNRNPAPHAEPQHSYRPSPRPFRPPSSSGGRRFGRR